MLPYTEFKEYMCEDIITSQFNPFVDDEGNIEIMYAYGDYKNGKSLIKFRVPGLDKGFQVRYTDSSPFAMWWCGITDGNEDDIEDAMEDAIDSIIKPKRASSPSS
jgi:hypothetical protein